MDRKFCGNCGSGYADIDSWPRTCNNCGHIAWKNPIPVTFVLQPVSDGLRVGLAMALRANNPCANQWSFIGGFVDMVDADLVEAAKREFREETGLETVGNAALVYSEQNTWGQMLVAVAMDAAMSYDQYCKGVVCPENLELGVLWHGDDTELCFPIHRKIAQMWFDGEI